MSGKKDGTGINVIKIEGCGPIRGHHADFILIDDIIEDYAGFCSQYPGGLRELYQQYHFGVLPGRSDPVSNPSFPEGLPGDQAPSLPGEHDLRAPLSSEGAGQVSEETKAEQEAREAIDASLQNQARALNSVAEGKVKVAEKWEDLAAQNLEDARDELAGRNDPYRSEE